MRTHLVRHEQVQDLAINAVRRCRRRRLLVAAAVAALLVVSVSAFAKLGSTKQRYRLQATSHGELIRITERPAAGLGVVNLLDGGTTDLAKLRGKPALLAYWASWCGQCRKEMPEFVALSERQGPEVQFVAVNVKDIRSQARQLVSDAHVTYPVVFDPDARTLLGMGHVSSGFLPFTFLLDAQGRIAAYYVGRVTTAQWEAALAMLRGEP